MLINISVACIKPFLCLLIFELTYLFLIPVCKMVYIGTAEYDRRELTFIGKPYQSEKVCVIVI